MFHIADRRYFTGRTFECRRSPETLELSEHVRLWAADEPFDTHIFSIGPENRIHSAHQIVLEQHWNIEILQHIVPNQEIQLRMFLLDVVRDDVKMMGEQFVLILNAGRTFEFCTGRIGEEIIDLIMTDVKETDLRMYFQILIDHGEENRISSIQTWTNHLRVSRIFS